MSSLPPSLKFFHLFFDLLLVLSFIGVLQTLCHMRRQVGAGGTSPLPKSKNFLPIKGPKIPKNHLFRKRVASTTPPRGWRTQNPTTPGWRAPAPGMVGFSTLGWWGSGVFTPGWWGSGSFHPGDLGFSTPSFKYLKIIIFCGFLYKGVENPVTRGGEPHHLGVRRFSTLRL